MDVRTIPPLPRADYFPPPSRAAGPSLWAATVGQDARELVRFAPVIYNMVAQELHVRYQRSVLGFLWTLLNPILMMTTMSLVFTNLFGTKVEHYAIYLFAGMVPWGFLSGCLNESAFCIISNEGLIRKIYLPKLVFPISKALVNLSTFLLSLGALFILLKPLGAQVSWSLVCLPLAVALFFLFALGLGMAVAVANTFYRDCGHLVSVFLQAWYFATPIIYELSLMPEAVRWRFWLNPAFPFVRIFQTIIHDGAWPPLNLFLAAGGIAAVSLGVGYATFKTQEDKLVFRL